MEAFAGGMALLLDPKILLVVFAGTLLGIVVGALPGISGSTTTALLLPFTITMGPVPAIAFLGAIYCAANFGGRSEEHTSELQSQSNLVCRLLLEKKKHRRNT